MGGTHASREPEARGGAVVSFCETSAAARNAHGNAAFGFTLRIEVVNKIVA